MPAAEHIDDHLQAMHAYGAYPPGAAYPPAAGASDPHAAYNGAKFRRYPWVQCSAVRRQIG